MRDPALPRPTRGSLFQISHPAPITSPGYSSRDPYAATHLPGPMFPRSTSHHAAHLNDPNFCLAGHDRDQSSAITRPRGHFSGPLLCDCRDPPSNFLGSPNQTPRRASPALNPRPRPCFVVHGVKCVGNLFGLQTNAGGQETGRYCIALSIFQSSFSSIAS